MFELISPVESLLRRAPGLWRRLDRHGPSPQPVGEALSGHVVVVGYGRVGQHIVSVLRRLNVPCLVVEQDISRTTELERQGVPTLYGDAADSEVLDHAGLSRARALVVTVPDEAGAEAVVAAGRYQNRRMPIIARAATQAGLERLFALGAKDVIHPELEGGLEILRHTLLRLGFPLAEVDDYAEAVRRDHYETTVSTPSEKGALDQLLRTSHALGIAWFCVSEESPLVGQPLSEVRLNTNQRTRIIAVLRDGQLIAHPDPGFRLQANDLVSAIGGDASFEGISAPSLYALDALGEIPNARGKLIKSDGVADAEPPNSH